MKTYRPSIHFVDNYVINPTNSLLITVVGAGGTGSQVITALSRMNHALQQLRHPGLQVTVYDDKLVTAANLGRQLFAEPEIGLPKSVALINRMNRFFGTNWKAVPEKFDDSTATSSGFSGHIIISCTDSVPARFAIGKALANLPRNDTGRDRLLYWMDFGNSRFTGQVVLSTVTEIPQPKSNKFKPVKKLPFVTEEFGQLLQSQPADDTPSCSLGEALEKQDLFINSTLANLGMSLLWSMFREGMLPYRGFFLNLKDFKMQPIPV
jgi:PRTRC genetic system ThiF family protein